MAQFVTRCPQCRNKLEVLEEWIGKTAECPACKKRFEITTPEEDIVVPKLLEEQTSLYKSNKVVKQPENKNDIFFPKSNSGVLPTDMTAVPGGKLLWKNKLLNVAASFFTALIIASVYVVILPVFDSWIHWDEAVIGFGITAAVVWIITAWLLFRKWQKLAKYLIIPATVIAIALPVNRYIFTTLLVKCGMIRTASIPAGITEIWYWSFANCSQLTRITIPDSVTKIGSLAFSGCKNLQSVTIPDSVTKIGGLAFRGCENLRSVTIPDSVTSIGNGAFSGCKNLQSVTIPDSVTEIGVATFSGCSNLQSVTIPDSVTTIGNEAFSGCSNLQSVTIPDSVTEIGVATFSWCKNLQSVTIPDSVTYIGDWAFGKCDNLQSVTIPRNCEVGPLAFPDGCKVTRR